MNMINCILLVLLLVVSRVLLKCTNSHLVIHFLNLVQLLHLNYNLACFLCDLLSPLVPNDYSCKNTFAVVSQIKNVNLSKKVLVSYNVTSLSTNIPLQETIAINLLFNPNLNITKKHLKNFSFLLHHILILF